MKLIKSAALLLLTAVLLSGSLLAQSGSKEALNKLFDFSKNKNYEAAAALIAYEGGDEERNHSAAINYADKDEQRDAKRVCKKIKALLDISSGYEVKSVSTEEKDKKSYDSIEVSFASGAQNLKTVFTFVKAGDSYLLTDID